MNNHKPLADQRALGNQQQPMFQLVVVVLAVLSVPFRPSPRGLQHAAVGWTYLIFGQFVCWSGILCQGALYCPHRHMRLLSRAPTTPQRYVVLRLLGWHACASCADSRRLYCKLSVNSFCKHTAV